MTLGTRVALVHDYWVTMRGGERVFLALRRLFPEADCFVLLRGSVELPADHEPVHLRSTPLQWLPLGARYYRALLLGMRPRRIARQRPVRRLPCRRASLGGGRADIPVRGASQRPDAPAIYRP